MRAERGRTKKLIAAFHFGFSNQAGWKCGDCKRNGLDAKRRCGWLPDAQRGPAGVVWGRKSLFIETCPKSYITAESSSLLESYSIWKLVGAGEPSRLPARTVEAFCVLESELRAEMNDATK